MGKGVVQTTPNTLITTLHPAPCAWRQEALAENARQVQQLGAELHGRLLLLSKHPAKVGKSLNGAVESYNEAVGSYERRVLVSARRFAEMGVVEGSTPRWRPSRQRPAGCPRWTSPNWRSAAPPEQRAALPGVMSRDAAQPGDGGLASGRAVGAVLIAVVQPAGQGGVALLG